MKLSEIPKEEQNMWDEKFKKFKDEKFKDKSALTMNDIDEMRKEFMAMYKLES